MLCSWGGGGGDWKLLGKQAVVREPLLTLCTPLLGLLPSPQYWYEGDAVAEMPLEFSVVWDGNFAIDQPPDFQGTGGWLGYCGRRGVLTPSPCSLRPSSNSWGV